MLAEVVNSAQFDWIDAPLLTIWRCCEVQIALLWYQKAEPLLTVPFRNDATEVHSMPLQRILLKEQAM